MTSRDAQLATLLRKAEWMLDDAAHAVGGGRMSSADSAALAEALDELAAALRAHDNGRASVVVDAEA